MDCFINGFVFFVSKVIDLENTVVLDFFVYVKFYIFIHRIIHEIFYT
jgi:hypothetical protein